MRRGTAGRRSLSCLRRDVRRVVAGSHLHRTPWVFPVVPQDETLVEELRFFEGASDDFRKVACIALRFDELPQTIRPEDGERLVVSLRGRVLESETNVRSNEARLQVAETRGDTAVLEQMPDGDRDVHAVVPLARVEGPGVERVDETFPVHFRAPK